MYQRMVEEGVSSNRMIGETTTDKVADCVCVAIRADRPEIIETGSPVRPLLAVGQLAPRLDRAAGREVWRHRDLPPRRRVARSHRLTAG